MVTKLPTTDHRLIYRNKDAKQKVLEQVVSKELDRLRKLNLNAAQ